MADFLLDSNAVIDFLRGHTEVVKNFKAASSRGDSLGICPTVYYEVVRGFKVVEAPRKLAMFFALFKSCRTLQTDIRAAEKAAEIYANLPRGVTIEDADIFIAAISMVNECTLVTSNVRHFSRVEGLNFVNWRLP